MDLKQYIRTIPDFPKPGIQFRDITTLLGHPGAFRYTIDRLVERYEPAGAGAIVGIESRGFIFGAALASRLGSPFVPIRKEGKLPYTTMRQEYALEYGQGVVEIHHDALRRGQEVLLVDDLLATGGTLLASAKLVELLGAEVLECAVVIELPDLGGRERLRSYKVFSMVSFAGD
jgi:adenine phosphoribosyltransferase